MEFNDKQIELLGVLPTAGTQQYKAKIRTQLGNIADERGLIIECEYGVQVKNGFLADVIETTSGANLDTINENYLPLAGGTVENLKVSGSLNAALWKGAGGRGLIDAITVTISGTIGASATGTLSGTFNIPNGYSSVGIIGYNLATYSLSSVTVKVAGNTVTIAVRNLTTSSVKVSSANVTVLLLKNAA